MPRGIDSKKTKQNRSTKITKWIKDENRKSLEFTDCFGEKAVIDAKTKCVHAIHTLRSNSRNQKGGYSYTYGTDSKKWLVSANGYMISFENPDKPKVIGTDDGKGYVNVWSGSSDKDKKIAEPTEKLHRVIWVSFAKDAIKNGTPFPEFIIDPDDKLRDRNSKEGLNSRELRRILTEKPRKHGDEIPSAKYEHQYVVHHKDLNNHNNSIDNLELMPWWMHVKECEDSIHATVKEFKDNGISVGSASTKLAPKEAIDEMLNGLAVDQKISTNLTGVQYLGIQERLRNIIGKFFDEKGVDFFSKDRFIKVESSDGCVFYRLFKTGDGEVFLEDGYKPEDGKSPKCSLIIHLNLDDLSMEWEEIQ